jgi:hypothetical protein
MKTIYTTICIVLITILPLHAQATFEKIEVKKGFPNPGYKYGEVFLSLPAIVPVLKKNQQAYKLIKVAKTNYSLANFLGYLGIGMAMAPLYSLFPPPNTQLREDRGKVVWSFVGLGLGTFAVAVPLRIKAHKQAATAVEAYNAGLEGHLYKQQPLELRVGTTNNGIGLLITY